MSCSGHMWVVFVSGRVPLHTRTPILCGDVRYPYTSPFTFSPFHFPMLHLSRPFYDRGYERTYPRRVFHVSANYLGICILNCQLLDLMYESPPCCPLYPRFRQQAASVLKPSCAVKSALGTEPPPYDEIRPKLSPKRAKLAATLSQTQPIAGRSTKEVVNNNRLTIIFSCPFLH